MARDAAMERERDASLSVVWAAGRLVAAPRSPVRKGRQLIDVSLLRDLEERLLVWRDADAEVDRHMVALRAEYNLGDPAAVPTRPQQVGVAHPDGALPPGTYTGTANCAIGDDGTMRVEARLDAGVVVRGTIPPSGS